MSLPEPIIEKIRRDVVATLGTVTRENGYSCDLIVEEANPALGNRVRDNLAVIIQAFPQKVDEEAYNFTGWLVPFEIWVVVVESESSTTSLDHRLNLVWADIVAALCKDDSYTRGNLALDTTVEEPTPTPRELNAHVAEMQVVVHVRYRHLTGNPFAQ